MEDWDKKQRAAKLKTYAEAVKNDKSGGVGPVQVHSDGSHLHYTAPGQLPHPHDDHAQVVGNAEAHGRIQSFHHAAAAANVAHNEAYPDRTGNPFPYPSSILPGNAPGATSALSVDPKTPGGSSRPTTFGSSSKGSNYLPPNSQIAQVQRETTARLHNDDIKKAGSSSGPVPKRTVARSGACSGKFRACPQNPNPPKKTKH